MSDQNVVTVLLMGGSTKTKKRN